MSKKEDKKIFKNYFMKIIVLTGFLKTKKDFDLLFKIDLELKKIKILPKNEKLLKMEELIKEIENSVSTKYGKKS